MRFCDVNHKKGDAVFVLIVKLVESGNLPPEGRSSVAAEDEDYGLIPIHFGKLDARGLVQLEQGEVGS